MEKKKRPNRREQSACLWVKASFHNQNWFCAKPADGFEMTLLRSVDGFPWTFECSKIFAWEKPANRLNLQAHVLFAMADLIQTLSHPDWKEILPRRGRFDELT